MKKTIPLILCLLASVAAAAAGMDDTCISFSTTGPDRYSDGSQVLDGECYALVWSSDGAFSGFTADGGCANSNDCVVLVAPVAKDGRCPHVLFQLDAATAGSLSGGRYAVFLLDTRVTSDGSVRPRGLDSGKLVLVNGYGAVSADVAIDDKAKQGDAKESESETAGQVAATLSATPPSAKQPKIKAIRVENGEILLTVENLKGYMRVHSGERADSLSATGAATETSGQTDEVTLSAPAQGSSGFYRIIRN